MSNVFHKDYVLDNNHALNARTYADIATRDADTDFQVTANLDKMVRVDSPIAFYILTSVGPTVFRDASVDGENVDLNTIHRSSDGKDHSDVVLNTAHRISDGKNHSDVVLNNTHRVSSGVDHSFIDQDVTVASSPQFASLVLTGDLTVQGTTVTLDATTLLVEDKNIELGNVAVPTDITADGGGITLKGTTDKTINWINATDAWEFNQNLNVVGNITLSGTVDGIDIATDVPLNTTHRTSDGKDHSDVVLNNTHRSSDGSDHTFLDQSVTILSTPIFLKAVIGTTVTPDGTLHVHTGSSGAVSASSTANALVVEDSTNNGISILTPDASVGRIIFGSPADPFGAFLAWSFSGDDFAVGSSKIGANLRLTSDQETTNLTLSGGVGSELATFAKDVTITGALSGLTQLTVDNIDINGNTISATNINGDLILDAFAAGSGVVKVTDQLEIAGSTSQLLLTDTDNDKTFIVKSNLGDFSITEIGGNNSFKILGGAAVNSLKITQNQVEIGTRLDVDNLRLDDNTISSTDINGNILLTPNGTGNVGIGVADPDARLEIAGQIKITGGTPGNSKYLRSDADGLATWGDVGWTDLGDDVVLLNSANTVGIGTPVPDTKLHVESGSAGVVTPFVGTIATFESSGAGYLSILTPDVSTSGILFGEPSNNLAGGIFYNDPGSQDGFQFRVNGNQTKMVIESDGAVGIGTTNPDVTAILDLSSTIEGFLPPRMTTVQRDAIVSPAPGLEIYNTTVDKSEVFTGTSWSTVVTEDLANIVVQETFASTNVRFFGELALPAAQGWTDVATGSATIDLVTQTVFGEVKQVVRHNDDFTNGSTTSSIALTSQNWTDIDAFGASYSGISRLDTTDGASGFFGGLQANAAENPLATGNRRYGILFNSDAGDLRVTEADNTGNNVTMDGTGGNPLVTFDEWFNWECVVPAGLGAAQFYINRILTTFVPTFFTNGGGLGTKIIVSSGSTGGANRIAYHDNFGTTIFEDLETKTLAASTMAGDVAQISIPEGRRDYTIILPDGNPRNIGALIRLAANNVGGSITLKNQNPSTPEVLYNGLRELLIDVTIKEVIEGINTVNASNVYIGFKSEDVDRSSSIFAQLHSIIDQIPTDVNPTVITYTNHDAINGIGHSTTINTGELEILPGFEGTYFVMAQPQVGKDSGGVKVDFDMFLQVDRGSGFVDEPNSNIKLTIKDSDITDVIVSAITIQLQVGDKIRMMQVVSNAAVGMGLKNTDPVTGPPTVPRTPSIIFTMYRVGG